MVALPKTRMNVQQFFDWWQHQPDGDRFELVDGVVFMMGRDRVTHNRAKTRAFVELSRAISQTRKDCEAFVDGMGVSPDDHNYRLPDAVVNCGPIDPSAAILPNPLIAVEIVSPRSEDRDVDEKLYDYFTIPSLRHYLIVFVERGFVVHHRRDEEGEIHTGFLKSGSIVLEPPGLDVSIDALLGGGR